MRGLVSLVLLAVLLSACTFPVAPQSVAQPGGLPDAPAEQAQPTPVPSFDELLRMAQDAANAADWGAAIAYLDAALAVQPDNVQAYWQRGMTQHAAGNLDAALADLDQALALDANLASGYQSRGLLHAQRGDGSEALADLTRAIELLPTFAQAYRNRAELQRTLGNYTAASFDLQVYLGLVPNTPEAAALQAEISALQQQAVAQAGEQGLLFTDDFSNPASGWYSNGGPDSSGSYWEGGYLLTQTPPNSVVWAVPGRIVTDTLVQVTATKLGGNDNNIFGLLCRVQGTGQTGDFYAFLISSDGYFGIAKKSGETLGLIGQEMMLRHSAIRLGGEPNVITAVCSGSRLALYVNGEFVVEAADDQHRSGQVGLLAGSLDEGSTQILFDDFTVRAEP